MFLSSMLRFPGQVVKVARHQTIDLAIIKIDGEMERSAPLVNVGDLRCRYCGDASTDCPPGRPIAANDSLGSY